MNRERIFWITFRRALLMIARAIEVRYMEEINQEN